MRIVKESKKTDEKKVMDLFKKIDPSYTIEVYDKGVEFKFKSRRLARIAHDALKADKTIKDSRNYTLDDNTIFFRDYSDY